MKDSVLIFNIGPVDWTIVRTYGVYRIPAGTPAEPSTLSVTDRTDVIDMGDNRRLEFPVPAPKIADDLTRDLHDFGVFVAEGEEVTQAELKAAVAHQTEVSKALIVEADSEWARSHNYRLISDLHRRAVKFMGLEREWCYEPQPQGKCPACGERLQPGVAICRSCRMIVDPEKAAKFTFMSDQGLVQTTPPAVPKRSTAKAREEKETAKA